MSEEKTSAKLAPKLADVTPLFAGPELSRPVPLSALSTSLSHFPVEANEAERLALAKRFDVTELVFLKGLLTAKTSSNLEKIFVGGTVAARVIQPCVVTLEPVETRIEETIDLVFARHAPEKWPDEIDLAEADENYPEPLQGEQIDLGELAAQAISLGISDYPRLPDAVFDARAAGLEGPKSPFAVLETLKKSSD